MKTLIIGGGLSGLALADRLQREGEEFCLLEARARFGGRIKTHAFDAMRFDLGPAWFWHGQPRMAAMTERFGLTIFEQFSDGNMVYEERSGRIQHVAGHGSMRGSLRLEGGLSQLIDRLVESLPPENVHLNKVVNRIEYRDDLVDVHCASGEVFKADRVVMALPPRLASNVEFFPALPEVSLSRMRDIPTWMAGQAKAVAVFETAFWRNEGFSGDAMSQHGPMVEIHDASPADAGLGALFGFIGVPPEGREDQTRLLAAVRAQFTRLFGPQAVEPLDVQIHDWAFDAFTSSELDRAPLYAHPTYGLPAVMRGYWDNRLYFSGTETAPQFGGFLEGALEAAETTFDQMRKA